MPQSTMLQPSRGAPPWPSISVAQQPEVDVVERERQAHAHPVHAGRDLERAPGLGGRGAEAVVELAFQSVHQHLRLYNFRTLRKRQLRVYSPCPASLPSRSAPTSPRPAAADVLDRRAGARVRPDDAGDPLLRGLRPARAGSAPAAIASTRARDRARLTLTLRGKRLGLKLARGEGAGRHVREPARHRRAAAPLPRRAARHRAQLEARLGELRTTLDEVLAQERRRSRCCASGRNEAPALAAFAAPRGGRSALRNGRSGTGMTAAPAFPAALTDARAFAIARAMLDGFDRHYRLFRQASAGRSSASRRPTGTASSAPSASASSSTTCASTRRSSGCSSEFEAGDAADGRLAAGQAALHRPADRPPPARAAPRPSSTR